MYRVKPNGRYKYKCPTCGVYIKARGTHCRMCICDILSNEEPGSWRERERKARKEQYIAHAVVIVSDAELTFDFAGI